MRFYQVDAFTREAFYGNPAGVCIIGDAEDTWMRHMADEIHASETAFLRPAKNGYDLRWFIPATEVDLCGHATLASAHILFSEGHARPGETLSFHTRSGILRARRVGDMIELDFPEAPPEQADPPPSLLKGLGVAPALHGLQRD